MHNGRACPQPAEVIKGRLPRDVQELLIRCEGQSAANATWVEQSSVQCEFPTYQLEDALVVKGERYVMTGVTYQHRKKSGHAPDAAPGGSAPDAAPGAPTLAPSG
jgi:hypothetical protein